MVAYRPEEGTRLAQEMPTQDTTLTQDATFPGGLYLVGIAPVRNSILLEHTAEARAQDTWNALMASVLAPLKCHVIQSTSDEALGLLAYVAPLGGHHSPDLFHVQPELSKAVTAPLAVQRRAAAKAVAQAAETLKRVHEPLANGELAKRGPGRPPKAPPGLEQAAQEVALARHEHQRLPGQRAQVTQSMRALGHAYHFVDLERGVVATARSSPEISGATSTRSAPWPSTHTSARHAWSGSSKARVWGPQGKPPSRSSRALCGRRCINWTWHRPRPPPCTLILFPRIPLSALPHPGQ